MEVKFKITTINDDIYSSKINIPNNANIKDSNFLNNLFGYLHKNNTYKNGFFIITLIKNNKKIILNKEYIAKIELI